jgi:hypothetical protein
MAVDERRQEMPMTEAEWLVCTDLEAMLQIRPQKISDRKSRLFACACCQAVTRGITEHTHRQVLIAAEQFADGLIDKEVLQQARAAAFRHSATGGNHTLEAARATANDSAWAAARQAARAVVQHLWKQFERDWASAPSNKRAVQSRQCDLLRDIAGNPFRTPLVDPTWQAWNDRTIPKMSRVIYDDRAFDRLPILADALEDAGCANDDILAHCRSGGEHVRGCWVVDLLLGKE